MTARLEPFAELRQDRPVLLVAERLKNCATVLELARVARAKGFEVLTAPGGFAQDIRIEDGSTTRNYTVRGAKLFIDRLDGV